MVAGNTSSLTVLSETIAHCRQCPRLVEWREDVAANPRASFADQTYWGRGVPGFGDPDAAIMIVGLAPAAHGANRTGRMFTGDRSGDFLYAALHRAAMASQPTSVAVGDGLELKGCWITSVVKCAPPANKPTPFERDTCSEYFVSELGLLPKVRVILALGAFAAQGVRRALRSRSPVEFGHGAVAPLEAPDGRRLSMVCSYHPSQQNTFTGKLTPAMLDAAIASAQALLGS